jgi:hypothetical protein
MFAGEEHLQRQNNPAVSVMQGRTARAKMQTLLLIEGQQKLNLKTHLLVQILLHWQTDNITVSVANYLTTTPTEHSKFPALGSRFSRQYFIFTNNYFIFSISIYFLILLFL